VTENPEVKSFISSRKCKKENKINTYTVIMKDIIIVSPL
jgi:hypothetical protein